MQTLYCKKKMTSDINLKNRRCVKVDETCEDD